MNALGNRIIYLLIALALAIPLLLKVTLPPTRLVAAESFFNQIESLPQNDGFVLVALDYGPNLQAENGAQAEVVIEHLLRRRIKIALVSLYIQGEPFLDSVPEKIVARLEKEGLGSYEYGKDWINLGYKPGGYLFVQSLAKSDDIASLLNRDARGNFMSSLPMMNGVTTIQSIKAVVELTGLLGMIDVYLQFLQRKDYRPPLFHGCTSITIPDAFIYLDSKQIVGLLEGVAGAAWYSQLLTNRYPQRTVDDAILINTGLGVAHLVVILAIILGNLVGWRRSYGR